MTNLPLIAYTMGDAAGVGPEIIARVWPGLCGQARAVVIGDVEVMRRAAKLVDCKTEVVSIGHPDQATASTVSVITPVGAPDVSVVPPSAIDARAGRAANEYLCHAIDLALAGSVDAIVTAPLHKESLRLGGILHPGHTEILAERTGVKSFAMVLAVPGLAVIHHTLHMALREVFSHLDPVAIAGRATLLHNLLTDMGIEKPRLGLAAINPHGGEHGLFGDDEARFLEPSVNIAHQAGINLTGPYPADTLFFRALGGAFDGIVAIYHDQGHIALKLAGRGRAVNISAGLPIVRTSVAHGTAFDIAWKGVADASGLVTATEYAIRLARGRQAIRG
jgi:4-hydroxythreonine-4-phosphate dehydrogenase